MVGVEVAPALSTTQEEEYQFAQVTDDTTSKIKTRRQYLGPKFSEKSDISDAELRAHIADFYSLTYLIDYLSLRGEEDKLKFNNIALQFPDSLVTDSAIIVQIIQNGLHEKSHQHQHGNNDNDRKHYGPESHEDTEIDFTQTLAKAARKSSCSSKKEPVDIEALSKCTGSCGGKCKNKDKLKHEKQKVWILADTSYSPCCIDEVASEHVHADIVVHFGDACLNPIDKLESAYVFGKPYLNYDTVLEQFNANYEDKETKVVLMADTPYSLHLAKLYDLLKSDYPNLAYADIDFTKSGPNSKIIDSYSSEYKGKTLNCASRIIYGLPEDDLQYLDEEDYDSLTQEYSLFHINTPEDPRLLMLSTKFGEITTIDTESYKLQKGSFPSLMRRYRFMHMARNASTIGILVNTLSLQNTKKLLNKVVKWVRNAGKKHYMFVVGKPNVAKLANFEDIDVWVVLGCSQGGIVMDNNSDFYKPVITPYELQMALNFEITWTGKWILDFQEVMNQEGYNSENEDASEERKEMEDSDYDDNAPEFNPVTGQLTASKPLRQLKHLEIELGQSEKSPETENSVDNGQQLVQKLSTALSIKNTVSTSAYHLQNRAWRGLGSDFQQQEDMDSDTDYNEGAKVEIGRSGIARDYHADT